MEKLGHGLFAMQNSDGTWSMSRKPDGISGLFKTGQAVTCRNHHVDDVKVHWIGRSSRTTTNR